MTEVLLKQITEITNEIKNIHGDDYGEQYCNVAINLISKNHSNIKDYQILIEAAYSLIDSDYKDKLIFNLQKRLKEQESRITHLEKDNKYLKEQNKTLKERVIKLEIDNKEFKELKEENKILKKEIKELKDDKQKFDALVKLHECNALVNKEFKKLYRIKFNKNKYDNNIPNIGDFINDQPTEDDEDNYKFWNEFNKKYPQSDNANFRIIYQKIANDISYSWAHTNVIKLNKTDFDKLIELIYPEEYNTNKELYNEYRDWLFMFPA